MSTTPIVIGQGTYGCVHKPSLKCKNKPSQNYTNKVSKILSNDSAKKEISEYKKVDSADKRKKFYLGKPDSCEADESVLDNMTAIHKCKIGNSVLSHFDDYSLLIMEDGGENLETYRNKMKSWRKSDMSTENCEKFLLEALRLFTGLVEFNKHDLVHHDLKPQNIVYNERTNRLNYIDFGLMDNKSKFIKDAKKSKYKWATFHWSYPWELVLLNKNRFEACVGNASLKASLIRTTNSDITNGTGMSTHMNNFFYYSMDRSSSHEYKGNCTTYIFDYEMMITRDVEEMTYDEFLNKSIDTVDVFGLGIALNYWFHEAKRHLEPMQEFLLEPIFSRMVTARLSNRLTPDEALFMYERYIQESGLLEKYDKAIVNGIVVDRTGSGKTPVSPPLEFDMKFRPDPEVVNADPQPCPEGKERNPKTRRCVAKCKDGYARDNEFKCKRNKTQRAPKVKAPKVCPENKEINPKTGRCIKKCKEGYTRDADFKCKR